MKHALILFFSSILALLAGCSSSPQTQPNEKLSSSASAYLAQANEAPQDQQATQLKLLAAEQMINDQDANAARQQLKQLAQNNLTEAQHNTLHLLNAKLLLLEGKPYETIIALGKIRNRARLNASQQAKYTHIASIAYARNNQIVKSLILQLKTQQTNNTEQLWHELQNLPVKTLNALQQRYRDDHRIQGWIRLALIANENSNDPAALVRSLNAWQETYTNHPANQFIPKPANLAQLAQATTPQQIALLLPLTGKFAPLGEAIRDGFLLAYFHSPEKNRPAIRIYDTNQQEDVTDLYQTAVNNGAQLIIGPVQPSLVKAISEHSMPVPTIALNYTEKTSDNNELIQFGLSPQQETQQAAQKAWQFGINRIVTITPNSHWGNMVDNAFQQTWKQTGGNIIDRLSFQSGDLKTQIAKLMGVSDSYQRKNQLEQILQLSLNFKPSHRADMNGFFVGANFEQIRQILPLLRFYFAGKFPMFAISNAYSTASSSASNTDLNGLYFCDTPLIIGKTPQVILMRKTIQNLWPQQYKNYARLYSIGIDSYHLAIAYSRITLLPDFGIQGTSGRLYLQHHKIYSQLLWAKVVHGKPKLLS